MGNCFSEEPKVSQTTTKAGEVPAGKPASRPASATGARPPSTTTPAKTGPSHTAPATAREKSEKKKGRHTRILIEEITHENVSPTIHEFNTLLALIISCFQALDALTSLLTSISNRPLSPLFLPANRTSTTTTPSPRSLAAVTLEPPESPRARRTGRSMLAKSCPRPSSFTRRTGRT